MVLGTGRLEGKVTIITGAASVICEATTWLFAEHGAYVIIADIQDELGHQVASSTGFDQASYWHCDVWDETQVKETVAYAVEKYGALHVMYSNAGIMGPLPASWKWTQTCTISPLAVNVLGVGSGNQGCSEGHGGW
ncbi:hypothetical protein CRG98_045591 [Punica granatum]|uniref:Uncharacterized protein n=1 Tax=Punica granatum TaxID=22663 RepID=A0A2I0HQP0_PUNGR|nr:hypothetical protein CRG98_045591 [Punica granatum]